MAPKIGPRGITIQDVQEVANNGSKAGKSQYVYAPTTAPTATSPVDYAALLAGGPASTYGLKYGGQPTGEYFKQLVTGAAMQNKSIGDLAALQAATNQENLTSKFASDVRSGTTKRFPSYQAQFNQPLVTTPGTRNYVVGPEAQSAQQLSDLENELNDLYVTGMGNQRVLAMGTDPAKVRALQNSIDQAKRTLQYSGYSPAEEALRAPRSQAEAVQQTAENKQNAYGAYMDRMNMLDLTKPGSQLGTFTNLRSTNEYGAIEGSRSPGQLLYSGARRQTAADLTPSLESAFAEQVTPYANVAESFANTPLSQFAQQIAVNRYGYDPALAQGLFGTDIDVQAMKDEAALLAAQNPQLSMTPAEAVYQQYGQDGLDTYVANMAQEAIYGTPAQQEEAAQTAEDAANAPVDMDLMSVYGVKPSQISPNDSETARQLMSDSNFLAQFQAGLSAIAQADSVNSPSQLEAQFVQQFMNDGGEPVTAILLDALLKKFTFG